VSFSLNFFFFFYYFYTSVYQHSHFSWSSPTEIGLECSEILRFLAEVLPYSTFLKKYLLQDQSKTNTKCLLQKIETETTPKLYYLTLLLNIVSVIGKTVSILHWHQSMNS
jgi:hypothetical protein